MRQKNAMEKINFYNLQKLITVINNPQINHWQIRVGKCNFFYF